MTPEPLVYTVPAVAARLGIDVDTVYRLISGGHLTARRLHPKGHLRILAMDLAAYLDALPAEPVRTAEREPEPAVVEAPAPKRDRRRVVRLLDPFAGGGACELGAEEAL
jgi:excisionase family DNA binding protein